MCEYPGRSHRWKERLTSVEFSEEYIGEWWEQARLTVLKKRLVQAGYYSILDRYESLHLRGRTAVYRTERTVV